MTHDAVKIAEMIFRRNRPQVEDAISFEMWRKLMHQFADAYSIDRHAFESECRG